MSNACCISSFQVKEDVKKIDGGGDVEVSACVTGRKSDVARPFVSAKSLRQSGLSHMIGRKSM